MKKQYTRFNIFSYALMVMISTCGILRCSEGKAIDELCSRGLKLAALHAEEEQIDKNIKNQVGFWAILCNIRDLNGYRESIIQKSQSDLGKFNDNCNDYIEKYAADKFYAENVIRILNDRHSRQNIENKFNYNWLCIRGLGGLVFSIPVIAAGMVIIHKSSE